MEMKRYMLAEKKIPKKFWAEAMYTVLYLLNSLLTKVVQKKSHLKLKEGLKQ